MKDGLIFSGAGFQPAIGRQAESALFLNCVQAAGVGQGLPCRGHLYGLLMPRRGVVSVTPAAG